MTEDKLINRYFKTALNKSDVSIGIGDDAAVLDVPDAYQLVVSVDTLLPDVHFPKNLAPQDIASRALAVCVSDLAAMGAIPKWLTLALTLPQAEHHWLENFSQALHSGCQNYQMQLVGGDTVKGPLSISLQVMGIVETSGAMSRSGAQVGDSIYVSGFLGGAALALEKIQLGKLTDSELINYFIRPQARVTLGRTLRSLATSCMDVSDGLLIDLKRLLKASHCGADIELDKVPLHLALENISIAKALDYATRGDDYELLFTVPGDKEAQLTKLVADKEITLSKIGVINSGLELHSSLHGQAYSISGSGYQHFK